MKLNPQALRNIQTFLVENRRDPSEYDVTAYWDSNLSFESNKKNIAAQLGIPYQSANKTGFKQNAQAHYVTNAKQAKVGIERQQCSELAESCEMKCNNSACKTFKKFGCEGDIEPCAVKDRRQRTAYTRKKTGSAGDCAVRSYCVEPHKRPPQHNSRTGKEIIVKGYCVTQHPRLCRRSGYE